MSNQEVSVVARPTETTETHEHGWQVESRHATSTGYVLYVRCVCGTRRVDLQRRNDLPPTPLSTEL